MKKKIFLIFLILLITALISGGVYLFIHFQKGQQTGNPLNEDLMRVRYFDDIKLVEEKHGVKSTEFFGEYSFSGVETYGMNMNYTFHFTESGYISKMNAFAISDAKKISEKEIERIISAFGQRFGIEPKKNYSVVTEQGTLDNSESETFKKIASGKARVEFKIREEDTTVWVLQMECVGEEFLCTITHYVDDPTKNEGQMNFDLT